MHRIEVNVDTAEEVQVQQKIYKNNEGAILVLDFNAVVPDGYSEINQEELQQIL